MFMDGRSISKDTWFDALKGRAVALSPQPGTHNQRRMLVLSTTRPLCGREMVNCCPIRPDRLRLPDVTPAASAISNCSALLDLAERRIHGPFILGVMPGMSGCRSYQVLTFRNGPSLASGDLPNSVKDSPPSNEEGHIMGSLVGTGYC